MVFWKVEPSQLECLRVQNFKPMCQNNVHKSSNKLNIHNCDCQNIIIFWLRLHGIGYVQIRLGSDPLWYGSILFTRDRFEPV